jgi:anti-sigma B factor antagonist
MSIYSLTRLQVDESRRREVLRFARGFIRRLEEQSGFEALQVFRADGEGHTFLVLTQWDSWESHDRAWAASEIATALREGSDRRLLLYQAPNRLDALFHIHFPKRAHTYSLGRLVRARGDQAAAVRAIEKEFGLKVMAAPGTVGVYSGQCVDDEALFFCRIDFDSEEMMAHVRFTSVRAAWNDRLSQCVEWEFGWQKVVRLEALLPATAERPSTECPVERSSESAGSLNLEMEVQPEEHSATLRFHGRMDDAAARKFAKVRDALIQGGCRSLVLDLSDLGYIASSGLQALLATAKTLKEMQGQLTVIDNEGRFNRIVRLLHLEQMLAVRRIQEDGAVRRGRRLS